MAIETWRAWEQVYADEDAPISIVAARTARFADVMGVEVQRRGIVLGWSPRLPWLLERSGIDPDTVPDDPYGSGPGPEYPSSGRLWPLHGLRTPAA